MEQIAVRYPDTAPLLLGMPDGRIRHCRALAHISGVMSGGELWVTGTGVDALVGNTLEVQVVDEPKPQAHETMITQPLDLDPVDLDGLNRTELAALMVARGREVPQPSNAARLRKMLREG